MASMSGEFTVRSGRVKHARRLATKSFRATTGEFLAEGPPAVREALTEGMALEIFVTPEAEERHADLLARAGTQVVWNTVSDDVLAHLADAVAPQGLVARCRQVPGDLGDVLATRPTLIVVCAEIRDPGNAGSVIRAADAVGAAGVVFAGDCVDPWSPKSVRASVGSIFHLPIIMERDVVAALEQVRAAGLRVLAADGEGDVGLYDAPLADPSAWLLGNEAWGLPAETRGAADLVVAIPIHGRAESLNLATAAAVCLYASARAQRQD